MGEEQKEVKREEKPRAVPTLTEVEGGSLRSFHEAVFNGWFESWKEKASGTLKGIQVEGLQGASGLTAYLKGACVWTQSKIKGGTQDRLVLVFPAAFALALAGRSLKLTEEALKEKTKTGFSKEDLKPFREWVALLFASYDGVLERTGTKKHKISQETGVWEAGVGDLGSSEVQERFPTEPLVGIVLEVECEQAVHTLLQVYPEGLVRRMLPVFEEAMQPDVAPPRILVVDDKGVIRMLIRRYLEDAGYGVLEASDGEEALRLLKKESVDLVLLDIMMPKMDGMEFCRQLREQPDRKGLPVIMCTAKGQRKDVVDAIKTGASDYIIKPFTKDVLLEKIGKLVPAPAKGRKVVKSEKAEAAENPETG
jgi:CheY-like chemotaxis protein